MTTPEMSGLQQRAIPDGEAGLLSPAEAGRAPGAAGSPCLPDQGLLTACCMPGTENCCCCCCWAGSCRGDDRDAVPGLPEDVPGLPEDVPGLALPSGIRAAVHASSQDTMKHQFPMMLGQGFSSLW